MEPRNSTLPDIQAEQINSIPLLVGVTNVRKYVSVQRNKRYDFPVTIEMNVMLPGHVRGGNLSRFLDSVVEVPSEVPSLESLAKQLANENKKRHGYDCIVEISAEIPLKIGWRGVKETHMIPVKISYSTDTIPCFDIEFVITGMANCPCAKACTKEGISHNQRSVMTVGLKYVNGIEYDLGVLVKAVMHAFSAPIRYNLKRNNEAALIEEASANSKFVEDIVRDAHGILKGILVPETRLDITVENHESVHPHNCIASWTGWIK